MAVVGAGPAGLSAAYYLARMGYPVTVFESLPRPGGMISVGIPPYRQPRDILEREIKIIEDAGVELRMGQEWGQDFSLSDLENQGFKAIFLAIGAPRSARLGVPGEEDGLEVTRWGTLEVAPDVLMTSREGVFAGGDLATGPLTVVHAVGAGRRAALMMGRYVRTGRPFLTDEDQLEDFLNRLETYEGGLQVPPKIPLREGLKTPPAKLPVAERIDSFREVESGMSQRSSLMEVSRCLRCAHLTLVALSPVTQELSAAEQGGRG